MISLLGRTGMNVSHVIHYAKAQKRVLLIDELDSIGKRRNDDSDVGELKRLVNVLLQQIDDWPSDGSLLLDAINHPGLLDTAIWRRVEVAVRLRMGHGVCFRARPGAACGALADPAAPSRAVRSSFLKKV